jgi:holliday junction DNA helicase RuvA
MIASLRGLLRHKDTEGAVIECGGVGYGVAMSLSALTRMGKEGDQVTVLVHTHLTQESLRLFAFLDADEKSAFEILLGTQGVGPRLALAILSSMSPRELAEAIDMADKGALQRIPGVGPKKAARLLIELKGRVEGFAVAGGTQVRLAVAPVYNDLVSALVNLGFNPQVAERAARGAQQSHPDETDLATLVRAALRSTTRVG